MKSIADISKRLSKLSSSLEIENFLLEILTESEVETLSKRWRILQMLKNGETQRDISKKLNVSLCKVTRGAKILKNNDSMISKILKEEK